MTLREESLGVVDTHDCRVRFRNVPYFGARNVRLRRSLQRLEIMFDNEN